MRRAVSKRRDPQDRPRAERRPCLPAKAKPRSDPDKPNSPGEESAQPPIHATLIGSNRCDAEGITARGNTPVLNLCRALLAAGDDPRSPLHAYRGDVLALKVRSIGEGAKLRVATHGVGFERIPECTGGSRVRQKRSRSTGTAQRGFSAKTYPPGKGPRR
jgi:hypothetical protein